MVSLVVNGVAREVSAPDARPLLWVLREDMQLTGSKYSCGAALCGACTVHVDGQPVRSCVTPAEALAGKRITTIEAVGATPLGRRVQEAWVALSAPQCGYCQSGQVMAAVALLTQNPKPSDAEIDQAMSGNICRCGMYPRMRAAVHQVAAQLAGAKA